MAVFPGAIRQFLTKHDQTDAVLAADVNSLQDEMTAVQTVLGTQPQGVAATVGARAAALETKFAKFKYGASSVSFSAFGNGLITHNLGVTPTCVLLTPVLAGALVVLAVDITTVAANTFYAQGWSGFGSHYTGSLSTVYWFVGA